MDKQKKGESLNESFARGVEKSKVETPAKKKVDVLLSKRSKKKARMRWLKELIYGSKTYLPEKKSKKPPQGKKSQTKKVVWKTSQEMANAEKLGQALAKLRKKGKKNE